MEKEKRAKNPSQTAMNKKVEKSIGRSINVKECKIFGCHPVYVKRAEKPLSFS